MSPMTVFDPEVAVAIGRCVTARSIELPGRVDPEHPRRCGWCGHPTSELVAALTWFNTWAGWSERSRTYERHDVRIFAELPRDQQRARVLTAQDFEPDEPIQEPAARPAHAAGPEAPSWFGEGGGSESSHVLAPSKLEPESEG